ncbi:hypothetical protein CTA1_807 [Colletotrichum tanaceti]|uniref:Uncharacterized protein n=1 Tax=Colletotrichum tanaceti TaxID=1306861 RepID=A0A4U6XQT0_9PEZI|nr:hypothetical protein CTA1_807 [Colletotrichum tanaceti]
MSPQQRRVSLRGKEFPELANFISFSQGSTTSTSNKDFANVCIVCCDSFPPDKPAVRPSFLSFLAVFGQKLTKSPALSFGLVEVSRANILHCALEPQLLGTCAYHTQR